MTRERVVALAGVLAWLLVGVPVLVQGADTPDLMARWAVAFLLFGACFLGDLRRARLWFLAVQSLCVLVMVLLLCDGFEGALMVLIAMRLGERVGRTAGLSWIVLQTLLLWGAIALHWNARSAWLLAPPYLGFQILAFFTVELMTREVRAHAELRALSGLVADSSRLAERLRLGQELHDALGHHLTALSLNLEVALRRTAGEAHEDVRKAQDLARQILTDVRNLVADKQEDTLDLAPALHELVRSIPNPAIHLQLGNALTVEDPAHAHVIFRCVQEIVTNAARHSGADHLWVVVTRSGEQFEITAHDDGRGCRHARAGFGLTAMRHRIEGAGGELRIVNGPERGFDVHAVLPLRSRPS